MDAFRRRSAPSLAAAAMALLVAPALAEGDGERTVLLGERDRGSASARVRELMPGLEGAAWAEDGVEACLECHDETEEHSILPILQTPHGMRADSRAPLAQTHGCQTCHGPSAAHMDDPPEGGERAEVAIAFDEETPPEVASAVCLTCHEGGTQMNWRASEHASHDVACTSCHEPHAEEDPMLVRDIRPDHWRREGQTGTCFSCHPEQRAKMHRLSSHPIKEGKVRCSDCHNPHGSASGAQLVKATVNQTCYQCHAEKRGPFLWEHAPVREDCGTCHDPHGSNHRALLEARTPWLCQNCHMAGFHPSTAYSGDHLPGGGSDGSKFLGKNCLNCHTEIHGSNHPSGPRFTR